MCEGEGERAREREGEGMERGGGGDEEFEGANGKSRSDVWDAIKGKSLINKECGPA